MDRYLTSRRFEMIFVALSIINLYILPIIAFHTMSGDKTDIIMGFGFGIVPLGWLITSAFYGIGTGKVWFAPFCTMIMCLPLFFVRVITGETIIEKVPAMFLVWAVSFMITFFGALLGRGIRGGIVAFYKGIMYIKEQCRQRKY